jgi:alpha-ketoglutarate-dependent taurine dioxygenase
MFDVAPITGVFGAQISNLNLAGGWDDDLISKIRAALTEHKVLLIRGQAGLSAQQLADFAVNFGAPEIRAHPVHGDFPGCPAVKVIHTEGDYYLSKTGEMIVASDADGWHTDGSTRPDTNEWTSFLFAQKIPPYGRDTGFADMEAAYDRLSAPMRQMLDGLTARHSRSPSKEAQVFEHPVVLADPATGRRAIYVCQAYTREIAGLREDESESLLGLLCEQTHRAQIQLRVVWEEGSLAIWDNRRTQHNAIMDHPGERIMYRVMVSPS